MRTPDARAIQLAADAAGFDAPTLEKVVILLALLREFERHPEHTR